MGVISSKTKRKYAADQLLFLLGCHRKGVDLCLGVVDRLGQRRLRNQKKIFRLQYEVTQYNFVMLKLIIFSRANPNDNSS